jgi:hypothetical protein
VVGSTATKVFGVFSALGTIAFGFGDTILPEIQARPQRLSVAAAALRMRAAAAVPQVLFVPFLIKHAKQEPHVVGAHVPQPSSRPPPRQQGPPCPACTRGVPEPPTRGPRLLPVVQATLKEPVKWNMYKAVALCYSVISISYIIVTVAGYWAFGNAVLPYLPGSFVGPTWAVRMSEFFALLQVVGCYQVGRWWCLAAVAALGGAVRYAGAFAI